MSEESTPPQSQPAKTMSQIGDYGIKGGAGALLGIIFMFAQDHREDQRKIYETVQSVQLAQVQSKADQEALRVSIGGLVRDIQANEEKIKQQWARSRRNDIALQLIAKELAALTKKEIQLPQTEAY